MDRKGHISYYTRIKSTLALLKAKNKIYPINNKAEIKIESMNLCKTYCNMYKKSFFQLLSEKNSNNESKGKFDVYCKQKYFIERRNI